jgi:hypothetical protein
MVEHIPFFLFWSLLDVTETKHYLSQVTRFIVLCSVANECWDSIFKLCVTAFFWNEVPYRTLHSRRLANES